MAGASIVNERERERERLGGKQPNVQAGRASCLFLFLVVLLFVRQVEDPVLWELFQKRLPLLLWFEFQRRSFAPSPAGVGWFGKEIDSNRRGRGDKADSFTLVLSAGFTFLDFLPSSAKTALLSPGPLAKAKGAEPADRRR